MTHTNNTPNAHVATLNAKFYAIEATYTIEMLGEIRHIEGQRVTANGKMAFKGAMAKDIANKWQSQMTAKGAKVEAIRFVAI